MGDCWHKNLAQWKQIFQPKALLQYLSRTKHNTYTRVINYIVSVWTSLNKFCKTLFIETDQYFLVNEKKNYKVWKLVFITSNMNLTLDIILH